MIFLTDIYDNKVDCEKLHDMFSKILPEDDKLLLLSTVKLVYEAGLLNPVESKIIKHYWDKFKNIAETTDSLDEILRSILLESEFVYMKSKMVPYLVSIEHINSELYSSLDIPIIKDYFQIKLLGQGSFGSVYLASNKKGSKVVIKKIKKITGTEYEEYEHLNKLKSECDKYFTCVIEAINTYDYFYIIMEYNKGYVPLEDCIVEISNSFTKKSMEKLEIVAKLMVNMRNGVKTMLEAGIVHKDIKPDNIMVNMTTGEIKFIDFGISCEGPECGIRVGKSWSGTMVYMDPYQFNHVGKEYISPRNVAASDWWALGITIYRMVTGVVPAQLLYHLNMETYFREYSYKQDPNRPQINADIAMITDKINLDVLLNSDPDKR